MGGGGVDIPQRDPGSEWQDLKKFGRGNINQYYNYQNQDPYFQVAQPFAISGLKNVSELTDPLKALLGKVPGQFDPLISSQQKIYGGLMPSLEALNRGELTPEQSRNAEQAALRVAGSRGMAYSPQGTATALLNREDLRQNRFQQGLSQALGLSGSIASLLGGESGLTTGLTQGIQGLGTQALQNVLGTSRAGVQNYNALTAPVFGWLSDLMSSNQNAAAAQSIAGANKSGGAMGGATSAIGSILGAVLPALMASDKNVKTDIKATGLTSPEGIPLKTFQYRGDNRRYLGVIAQDVEKKRPDAVIKHPLTGQRFVDLLTLNVPFTEVKPARARVVA